MRVHLEYRPSTIPDNVIFTGSDLINNDAHCCGVFATAVVCSRMSQVAVARRWFKGLRVRLDAPTASVDDVCAALAATTTQAEAQAATRQVVVGEGQRVSATLSPGIRVGNMLFASGQLGTSPNDTTIAGQTTRALENTEKVFKAAGTTLANAVKCTVFLTDVKDFRGMNEAYTKFFPSNPPARSTGMSPAGLSRSA